jgi:hypothetical protein
MTARTLLSALGNAADRDVAVGDHADQLVVPGDRQRAGIDLLHQRRRIAKRPVRVDQLHLAAHDIDGRSRSTARGR